MAVSRVGLFIRTVVTATAFQSDDVEGSHFSPSQIGNDASRCFVTQRSRFRNDRCAWGRHRKFKQNCQKKAKGKRLVGGRRSRSNPNVVTSPQRTRRRQPELGGATESTSQQEGLYLLTTLPLFAGLSNHSNTQDHKRRDKSRRQHTTSHCTTQCLEFPRCIHRSVLIFLLLIISST